MPLRYIDIIHKSFIYDQVILERNDMVPTTMMSTPREREKRTLRILYVKEYKKNNYVQYDIKYLISVILSMGEWC